MSGRRTTKGGVPKPALPDLRELHARHPGLTAAQCATFFEALCVTMDRHHDPPSTTFAIDGGEGVCERGLAWRAPSDRERRSQNNRDDATRDAACLVALGAIESTRGMVTYGRMDTRTGADYLVAEPGLDPDDLEDKVRLEVAGQDAGRDGELRSRLKRKVRQVQLGHSCLPGMAAVVGFHRALALVVDVERPGNVLGDDRAEPGDE